MDDSFGDKILEENEEERFIKERPRSFDLIRDSEDDDEDSDEDEDEFDERRHAFKYVQRAAFAGTKKRSHLEPTKNFRGHHQEVSCMRVFVRKRALV